MRTRMSIAVLAVVGLLVTTPSVKAQEHTPAIGTGFGVGFHLSQVQGDFGLGVNLTSPTFVNDHMGVRLRGTMTFLEHLDNDGRVTWTPYSTFQLGAIGFSGTIGESIRCYGEGGVVVVLPHSDFSSANSEFGGYGLFGFEFFLAEHMSYNIELGGTGTGARADRVPTDPLYNNGFSISTGFRVTF